MSIIIGESTRNSGTVFGMAVGTILAVSSFCGMAFIYYPPKLSFEWVISPILFVGSVIALGVMLKWLINPKIAVMEIAAERISVSDELTKWRYQEFDASGIRRFVGDQDRSRTWLEEESGKRHRLGSLLSVRRAAIVDALTAECPWIEIDVAWLINERKLASGEHQADGMTE